MSLSKDIQPCIENKISICILFKEVIFYILIIAILYSFIYYISLFLGGLVANLIIIH